MALLSSPITEMAPCYDVVVIGSGYGGAISAATLARARRHGRPLSVALLEKGEEIPTGRFPDEVNEALNQFQVDNPRGRAGNDNGLYYVHSDDDITVIQGCGLGGTSLINANVSLPPEERVWSDERWPAAIRDDADGRRAAGLQRALEVLRPTPYPDDREHPPTLKYAALQKSGESMGAPVYHPPINVTFEDGLNPSGMHQRGCTGCGDCVSGCNVSAKNTLMYNYLPEARADGARIFCGVNVRTVTRGDGGWLIRWQPANVQREAFGAPPLTLRAEVVVLAAGSLGSTEILLRSRAAGLSCSDRLGARFTGNGDVLGFGYNCDQRINGIGIGASAAETTLPHDRPGPTITGALDLRDRPELADGVVIEEGALPSPLRSVLPLAFTAAGAVIGQDTDQGVLDETKEKLRTLKSNVLGADAGAVQHTQTYLVMAHDDAEGRMELADDRLRIRWDGVGRQPMFARIYDQLRQATAALGGTLVPSPLFSKLLDYNLVTVHPLGGCPMAERAEDGAVNDRGQLFSGAQGDGVHADLYVLDGAIIPRPLGVNPLLTIAALAERGVELLAADRHWAVTARPEQREQLAHDGTPDPGAGTHLWFTERLTGHLAVRAGGIGAGDGFSEAQAGELTDDFAAAEKAGQAAGSTCSMVVTISTPDLAGFVRDPEQLADAIGTVELPALDSEPFTTTAGRFNLLVSEPGDRRDRRMRYRLPLVSASGRRVFLDGHKVVRDEPGIDVVSDTTTLFVAVHEGEDDTGPVIARGVIRIAAADFARQLTTFWARRGDGRADPVAAARFGRLFAGGLWDTYQPGGVG